MEKNANKNVATATGWTGTIIAITISWSINKSILWCILHGIFGWGYVIYYALGYGRAS